MASSKKRQRIIMSSAEEGDKIAKDVRILKELHNPEIKLNAIQYFQLLTRQEVHNVKDRLDSIEAGFRTLQEANVAADAHNEDLERQLDELKKKQEELQLSTVDSSTQDMKESLTNLREKVNDELVRLSAEDVRFIKDIKRLNKELGHHSARFKSIEKAVKDIRSDIPELTKIIELNDTLSRLEATVRYLQEKFGSGAAFACSQKEVLEETATDQAALRQSLDTKQERLLAFIDKLSETDSSQNISEAPQQMTGAGGNGEQLPSSMPPESPPVPEKAQVLLDRYNHFCDAYKKHPKNEERFIKNYLRRVDPVSSWFIQKQLLKLYPDLVTITEAVEIGNTTGATVFISPGKLVWRQLKAAMRKIKPSVLFPLLETEQGDLEIPRPSKRDMEHMELDIPNTYPMVQTEQMGSDGVNPFSVSEAEQTENENLETQPRVFDLRPKRRRTGYRY